MWQNYFYNLKAPKWLVLLLCFRVLLACCGYVKDTAVCADLLRAGEAWHEAVLVKVSHPAESSTMYVLRLQSGVKVQIFQNSAASARPAYLANSYDAADELFLPGDKLSVKLRLSEPQPPRNPGNFNEQWHFFTQDIQLKADLLQYARGDAAGSERRGNVPAPVRTVHPQTAPGPARDGRTYTARPRRARRPRRG